jgi:hypothetical protein
MGETISTGAILIRAGASLPETLRIEGETFASCWRLIKNMDGYGLDRKIRDMGWSLIRMAGEVKSLALGFDEQKTACKALKQGLARLKSYRFNCLEISQVKLQHFAGLYHARVLICPRHIQKGLNQKKADLPQD